MFLELAVAAVAVLTIVGVAVTYRSRASLRVARPLALQEKQMNILQEIRAIGQKLQDAPNGPDAPALRERFAALNAAYLQDNNVSLAHTKAALAPMIAVNFAMAGVSVVVALGGIGYLLVTQPGPVSIGAAIFLLIMIGFSSVSSYRWWRSWVSK